MSKPVVERYHYHAILCCGKRCEPEEDRSLFQYLQQRIAEEGLENGEAAVRANRASCLGVYEQGPIMVIYPDGVWYYKLNRGNIDRIIEEHFKQGKIVESLAFHIAEK